MNIAVLDGHTLNPGDNPWDPIGAQGTLVVYDRTSPDQVVERAASAECVFVNKTRLSAEHLKALPKLRYIGVLATGVDVVDLKAAADRGIPVCNAPAYGAEAVAQQTFALLLELCRHVGLHDASVHAGEWSASPDYSYWKTPQIDLSGKTLGLFGFGDIGRLVGGIAHAFGMRVLAHVRHQPKKPEYEPFAFVEQEQLLAGSDVLSLHVPLTPATAGLINHETIGRMRPGAILINTARGPLLDEPAVAEALRDGRLGGAGLDVVSVEPIRPDNPLLTAPNCVLTPHVAWATLTARRKLMRICADNLAAFLAGTPRNVVNGL